MFDFFQIGMQWSDPTQLILKEKNTWRKLHEFFSVHSFFSTVFTPSANALAFNFLLKVMPCLSFFMFHTGPKPWSNRWLDHGFGI